MNMNMIMFTFQKTVGGRGGPSHPALSVELAPSTPPCQISYGKCYPHLQATHHNKQRISSKSSNAPHWLLYRKKLWVGATHVAARHLALSTANQLLPTNHHIYKKDKKQNNNLERIVAARQSERNVPLCNHQRSCSWWQRDLTHWNNMHPWAEN